MHITMLGPLERANLIHWTRASVEGETPTLLGPLKRANLTHWTVPVRFTTAI
jgi:hypothetical protein